MKNENFSQKRDICNLQAEIYPVLFCSLSRAQQQQHLVLLIRCVARQEKRKKKFTQKHGCVIQFTGRGQYITRKHLANNTIQIQPTPYYY